MPLRSLIVTDDLLRSMAGDAARLTFTRPRMLVLGALFAVMLVFSVLTIPAVGVTSTNVLTILFCLVVPALVVFLVVRQMRQGLRAAVPAGSTLGVDVRPEGLRVESVRGVGSIPWSAFRDVRVGRTAVLLRQRGTGITSILARQLLDDDDIALIRRSVRG